MCKLSFFQPEFLVDFGHRADGEGEEVPEFHPELGALADAVAVDAGGERLVLHLFLEAGGLHAFHARGAHERRRDHESGHGFPAAQRVVEGGGGLHAGHFAVVGADGVQGFLGQAVADAFGADEAVFRGLVVGEGIVEIVQQAGQPPDFLVLPQMPGEGAHDGFRRQRMLDKVFFRAERQQQFQSLFAIEHGSLRGLESNVEAAAYRSAAAKSSAGE